MLSLLTLAAIVGSLSVAAPTTVRRAAEPPGLLAGYRDSAELESAARALASAHPDLARVASIGTSRGGRDIVVLTLGRGGRDQPAILIAAGLDGTHALGGELAVRAAKVFLDDHAAALESTTIHIVVVANPDALEQTHRGPIASHVTTRAVDDDRDGTADEDGPRDLNGDGAITQMRVKAPPPPFHATFMLDEKDPRLLRSPDASKGERAEYLLLTESIDADGDGRLGEDGPGGVDLDRNFPHRWPEFTKDAGPVQMSEPESKALTAFVMEHPEVLAAIVLGRHDTLVTMPDQKEMDATGRTPMVYLTADHPLYQEIGKLYRDTTGQSRTTNMDPAGSFWLWLANHRGLIAVATTGWGRPDAPKPEEAAPDAPSFPAPEGVPAPVPAPPSASEPPAAAPSPPTPPPTEGAARPATGEAARERPRGARGGGVGRAARGPAGSASAASARGQESAAVDQDAAEWIAYFERDRGGMGFVPWQAIDHPLFGTVEVGGIDPLAKLNPPAEALEELARKQAAFWAAFADRLPALEVAEPTITRIADGLWRVESSVTNRGRLPTTTRMARTARSIQPLVVRVNLPLESFVSGERVRRIEGLDPGERATLEWIVRAAADEAFDISIGAPGLGVTTFRIQDGAVTTPSSAPNGR